MAKSNPTIRFLLLCTIFLCAMPLTKGQAQKKGSQERAESQPAISQTQDLQFSRGRGPCWNAWPNLDPEELVELQGVVTAVDLGTGRRFPSFTLDDEVTIYAGPYRVWMESNFKLSPEDSVSVRAFPSPAVEDAWVAIEITRKDGRTLVLRDESGRPRNRWGRGRRGW